MTDPTRSETAESSAAIQPIVAKTTRLLVIDDDRDDFYALERKLKAAENRVFQIVYVESYDGGLQEIEKSDFDVILIDYFIGNRSGTEIFEAFDDGPKVPVIVLTGSKDREVERDTLSSGAFDFLDKGGLSTVELVRSIDFAIQRFGVEQGIKKDQEMLRRACENAEAAHYSKTEFLEFLGAEIKTPLNAIIGFSQAMNDDAIADTMPEACRAYSQVIHESGLQLDRLVADLLDLSKTDTEAFDARNRRFKRFRSWIVDRDAAKDWSSSSA